MSNAFTRRMPERPMAEPQAPTFTDVRLDLLRWMETRGVYSVRDVLALHLLAHAEVTHSPKALAALHVWLGRRS